MTGPGLLALLTVALCWYRHRVQGDADRPLVEQRRDAWGGGPPPKWVAPAPPVWSRVRGHLTKSMVPAQTVRTT